MNCAQIGAGRPAQKKTEYPIEEGDEGLFVIICNTEFKYNYKGINLREHKMDYREDINRIKETFKLDDDSKNLLIREELPRSDPNDTEDFDRFMTEVVLQKREVKFLMLFLLSHGYRQSAEFLLAENKDSTEESCCTRKVKHSQEGDCYARDIVKDVIGSVQKSSTFSDVPKIFVVQTCQGIIRDEVSKAKGILEKMRGGGIPSPDAGKYIPRDSDTLVLYSCIEAHESWIEETAGPFLVRNFCKALDNVRDMAGKGVQMVSNLHNSLPNGIQADKNIDDRKKKLNDYRKRRGWDNLLFCPEAFANGWLTSVCQKTMVNIATFLKETKENAECVDFPSLHAVEQRPEVSSTLRYKLSMIKVLRTQWKDL